MDALGQIRAICLLFLWIETLQMNQLCWVKSPDMDKVWYAWYLKCVDMK